MFHVSKTGKNVPLFIKYHTMKAYGSGSIAPRIYSLGTDGGEWLILRSGRFNFGETTSHTTIDKMLGGTQIKSEPSGVKKDLFPLPRIEPRLLSRPGRSLVTVLTELSRLPCFISCF
jgi:hypothetical protein